jgi:hypothetical protein
MRCIEIKLSILEGNCHRSYPLRKSIQYPIALRIKVWPSIIAPLPNQRIKTSPNPRRKSILLFFKKRNVRNLVRSTPKSQHKRSPRKNTAFPSATTAPSQLTSSNQTNPKPPPPPENHHTKASPSKSPPPPCKRPKASPKD